MRWRIIYQKTEGVAETKKWKITAMLVARNGRSSNTLDFEKKWAGGPLDAKGEEIFVKVSYLWLCFFLRKSQR